MWGPPHTNIQQQGLLDVACIGLLCYGPGLRELV